MKNDQIIFEAVRAAFTPAQLAELVAAVYSAERIAARRAALKITVDPDSGDTADAIFNALLAADTFHTVAEWNRLGYRVQPGQHAALVCYLWKHTDKPGRACKEAAATAGEDTPESDPHFYRTKAHLFSALQVIRADQMPAAPVMTPAEIAAHNKRLAAERKARRAAQQAAQ